MREENVTIGAEVRVMRLLTLKAEEKKAISQGMQATCESLERKMPYSLLEPPEETW